MAVNLEKLKSIITPKSTKLNNVSTVFLNPEVGFKILHNSITKELKVTVIGGRHFPGLYGLNRVHGYIIKVKIFPGQQKFETNLRTESWPLYNEEFTFTLDSMNSDSESQLNGKFLVITAYAILENNETPSKDTENNTLTFEINTDTLRRYQRKLSKIFEIKKTDQQNNIDVKNEIIRPKSLDTGSSKVNKSNARCMTFEKRRTIGSTTFSILSHYFTKTASNFSKSTDEIWKNLEELSTGSPSTEINTIKPIVERKGDVEVGLLYKKSDSGERCLFIFSLSKMRCSLQIMQRHEHLNGYLYLKLKILNDDQVVAKGRTEQFNPSISHKFDSKTSNIKANFNITDLESISFQIVLMSKTKTGKKTLLGKILLSSKSKSSYLIQWEKALENPSETVTMWQQLE